LLQKFIAKLSHKERSIFYVAIFFVSFALIDRLFLGPVLDKLHIIDEDISQQEISIFRDFRFLSYKDRIIEESEAFNKYFMKEQKDADVINAEFLQIIEKIATESKINLVKSNPSEVRKKKNYIEYFANLDCTGDLNDIIIFMHKINSTEELLKIVRFNMNPRRGTANDVNISMTIVKMIIHPDITYHTTIEDQ